MDSRVAFSGLILLVGLMRLLESCHGRRNTSRLLARGGIEFGAEHYWLIVAVHSLFFASIGLELWLLRPPFRAPLAIAAATMFVAAMALRWWVIKLLGEQWTTRIVRVPGDPIRRDGPYRWMQHPNYVGVAGEFASLPLVHGCWITATMFTLANLVMLRVRVRRENVALMETS